MFASPWHLMTQILKIKLTLLLDSKQIAAFLPPVVTHLLKCIQVQLNCTLKRFMNHS